MVESKSDQYAVTFCKIKSELRIQGIARNHSSGVNVGRRGKIKDGMNETKAVMERR